MFKLAPVTAFAFVAAMLSGCGQPAKLQVADGTGAAPTLPAPSKSLVPTLHIAPAIGWSDGATPTAAPGTRVSALANGLDHPRWLYVLPNGDVLVAETNAPPKPEDGKGPKAWVQGLVMGRAGANVPSANRITLLRDVDGDGVAETRSVFIDGLSSPFGMVLVGNDLYVADSDALLKFPYTPGTTHIAEPGTKVLDLPAGPINHHWTKNVIASADGEHLYVTIGSNSNVAENGISAEEGRADIWEVDAKTGQHRVYASGLRNPNGMAWQPDSGKLWVVVNERDELGSDLVPDYMTSVTENAFYGWPYSYYGQHVDDRVKPPRPDMVAKAVAPDYALGPHTASLGLASAKGNTVAPVYADGMFVGQHGSWNRKPFSGYKVVFVPFQAGKPSGQTVDVLTGFVDENGKARGRPVGVVIDKRGGLLVADDVGNTVWRVTGSGTAVSTAQR